MGPNQFAADAGNMLSFIGGTIIRRDIWLERDRESYYGTLFIHVGVILQKRFRGRIIVVGEPSVAIRLGNSMWSPRSFEIWMFKWPDLIWSFDGISAKVKEGIVPRDPWKSLKTLISFRSNGAYRYEQYKQYFGGRKLGWRRVVLVGVSLMPGILMNIMTVAYIAIFRRKNVAGLYNLVYASRYSNWISQFLVRVFRYQHFAI